VLFNLKNSKFVPVDCIALFSVVIEVVMCIYSQDIVTRFAHQSGYHVERRFGWDCHGLPVV